jgi:exopolyphosphatase / guanosine-5'-triphosphate,3'-diphosphate pyrophosphatase
MILGAIDIGSNAARLLITEVVDSNKNDVQFNKLNLIRVPLRLGFDVFEYGEITKPKQNMLFETMKAYAHLMKAYHVEQCIACATSAMRDAKNSNDLIRTVKLETGIEIKVISGDEEASMIYENHIAENLDKQHAYMYIDVGGGSTELTFFDEGVMKYKKSFNIGTIRLLKGLVNESIWDEMKSYIKQNTKTKLPITAIGSGGNINKVFSISKKKEGKPLQLDLLKDYHKEIGSFSIEERIKMYKFREDRADVIVPALQIYINAMRWADITEIYVPKIGLADGLIQKLYSQIK